MSLEFVQFKMPCKVCVVQAICKDKHHVSTDLNPHNDICLGLPVWNLEEKMYIKGVCECWINLGYDIIRGLKNLKLDNKRKEIDKQITIPDQYINFLIDMINATQWLVNSTSWEKGELYKFDSFEIKNKIKFLNAQLSGGK